MTSVQSIANKLSQVSGMLTEMQQSGNAEQLEAVLSNLGQMDAELKSMQAGINEETSNTVRQELVNCRVALSGMQSLVSDIRSETAERYRQTLGDQKASFEQMDESTQQSTYPEAYQHRQMFKQMDVVSSQLNQLNGAMLDVGHQAGRSQQNGNGATYGDSIPEDLTSENDTTRFS